MEILHQIIKAVKAGEIAPARRPFNKVILAGHSYGSIISNVLNEKYPDDVDATILTGFSSTFKTAIVGGELFFCLTL
jgi:pimeloyl-ACP methyl ester carboxylesterase